MIYKDYLGNTFTVTIDRPIGSKHPKFENLIYPVNYGFIEGIIAPDGHYLDAYILGVFEPVKSFTGRCIAIIHRLNDVENKLVIAEKNKHFNSLQIQALVEFQERFFETKIIL